MRTGLSNLGGEAVVFRGVTVGVLLLLSLALVVTGTLAARNTCDVHYANKLGQAGSRLDAFYRGRANALFRLDRPVPLRFPAALWYFSKGDSTSVNTANILLTKAFNESTNPSSADAFYLAWIEHAYKEKLTSENQANITQLFSTFTPPASPEAAHFLGLAAQALFSDTPSARQALIAYLKQRGDEGWSSATNQHTLSLVVQGLNGLLAGSDNATIQTLAEMNLDVIMARFAALDVGGQFALVGGGDSLANNAFEPKQRPWYGWSQLFFTGSVNAFVEPTILLSGYCPNEAVRAIKSYRDDNSDAVLVSRDLVDNKRRYARITSDSVMASTADGDTPFTDEHGFLTRAGVWFKNGVFLTLSTRTSNDSTSASADAVPDDQGRLFAANNVILGRLGDPNNMCKEPHAYASRLDDVYNAADLPTPGAPVALEMDGHYFLLTFLGGAQLADVTERYRPMAGHIPSSYGTLGDPHHDQAMGDRGIIIFPKQQNGGLFALEAVPQTVIDNLNQRIDDQDDETYGGLDIIAALTTYSTTETSLTESGKTLTYKALDGRTYTYNPASGAGTPTLGQFSLRNTQLGSYAFLSTDGTSWTIRGELNSNAKALTLNFNDVTRTGDGLGDESSPPGGGATTPSTSLSFLAGSLLKDHDAYVLDCGDPADVLPNPPADSPVKKACVMRSGDTKTNGLVYDTTQDAPVTAILQELITYYPFSTEPSRVDATMCDDQMNNYADAAGLTFVKCGSIPLTSGSLSVWVDPAKGLLVFSTDANPFTSGWLDGLTDFLAGLFGAPADGVSLGQGVDAAYFLKEGKVNISAVRNGDAATLTYTGLGASVKPLLQNFGSRASYRAGGDEQRVLLDSINPAEFRQLTAALRPDTSAAPMVFKRFCGNGVVENPNDDGVHEECDDGNRANNDNCNNSCQLVGPPASQCQDLDGDGYNGSTSSCTQGTDCDDQPPANVEYNHTTGATCDGIDSATQCGEAPTSICPQCVHPSAGEICGDGKDNDCSGGADNGCVGGGTGGGTGEDYSCPAENTICSMVCGVESRPPQAGNPCPTDWRVNTTQGHYTFSTRTNKDGVAELKIDADGVPGLDQKSPDLVRCTLCEGALCKSGKDFTPIANQVLSLEFTHPNPSSSYKIFHDGGSANGDTYIQFQNGGWSISGSSSDANHGGYCWDMSGGSVSLSVPTPPHTCVPSGCPSDWSTPVKQGEYTFSWRWNEQGRPELKVQASGAEKDGHYCTLDGTRNGLYQRTLPLEIYRTTSGRVLLFDYLKQVGSNTDAAVFLDSVNEDGFTGWKLSYKDGGVTWVKDCWNTSGSGPLLQINPFNGPVCHLQDCKKDVDCDIASDYPPGQRAAHASTCQDVASGTKMCLYEFGCIGGRKGANDDGACGGTDGAGCFTPDTPVTLAEGTTTPISKVEQGDVVLGYDGTGFAPTTVQEVLVHPGAWGLLVVNGALHVTPDHMLRTTRGWIPAGELKLDDRLLSPDGEVPVTSITRQAFTGKVYNLHNKPYHNYVAGGVLVHNVKKSQFCEENPSLCTETH